jgi:Negative regulator of genetic competence, sporulation and motility
MELIMINESKLKVMMSASDMEQYEISCEMIDYGGGTPAETRKAFWRILDEAKDKTGFDAAGDRVFVQVYPSKSGGCEMFVTKLNLTAEKDAKSGAVKCTSDYIKRIKSKKQKRKYIVYGFDTVDDLLLTCSRLVQCSYEGTSSAYSESAKYYLTLENDLIPYFFTPCEYNAAICTDAMLLYVNEYCDCICSSDAVTTLGALV